ncbi:hypothetical protein TNCV_2564701 [Trichonephila clavipes]|nr:hypothetical protein TNCV_2564701 [Trichonephila clavipes]
MLLQQCFCEKIHSLYCEPKHCTYTSRLPLGKTYVSAHHLVPRSTASVRRPAYQIVPIGKFLLHRLAVDLSKVTSFAIRGHDFHSRELSRMSAPINAQTPMREVCPRSSRVPSPLTTTEFTVPHQ